ncbi:hypothetical protein [Nonomuraea dietziae]|uniref:TolB family protein n=1 Tax=Nonomuraea dietziae TaxID=65515 RepID=UPI0031E47E08
MNELTPQLIVDGAVPLHSVISPDGRWVAYTVAAITREEQHPSSALWVAATDGSSPPRKLTEGRARDSNPRWAPDSASLFFESDRLTRGTAQLHRIPVDGGQARALTTWRSGIRDHLPLADGRRVAVMAEDPPSDEDERRKAERDDAKVWGQQVPYGRLRLLELDTGRSRVVDGLGDRHVVEVTQRPDGGPLAVLSRPTPELDPVSPTFELHVVDPETMKIQNLGQGALEAHK